jgi:uncharacterized protein (DUF1697 family)
VPTHVAFLRGINITNRRVSKDRLVAAFEAVGFEDVSTFRASGNVIFGAGSVKPEAAAIEEALERGLGYPVPTYLRSARQVSAIAARTPFSEREVAASKGKLQVVFLKKRPTKSAGAKVLAMQTDHDRLALEGSELFWLPKGGTQESELDLTAVDAALGPSTHRTIGTVQLIAARL